MFTYPVFSTAGLSKEDLIAWWEFNETSGSRIDSVSGLELALTGTAPRITGPGGGGYGVQLRNASNAGLVGTFDDLRHSGSYSIACWISVGSGANVNNQLFAYSASAFSSSKTDFMLTYGPATTQVRLYQGSGGAWRVAQIVTIPGKSTWFHMVYTYDDTTKDYTLTIDAGTPATGNTAATLATSASSPMKLALAENYAFTLDSDFAQWSYWRRVLDSSEIEYIYNGGVGLPYSEV